MPTPSVEWGCVLRESCPDNTREFLRGYRQAVAWRHIEQLSWDEIGRRMNCSPDAARKIWSRAILQLRRELVKHEPMPWAVRRQDSSGYVELRRAQRQILRALGRGGFGIVFLAWDPLHMRKVALTLPQLEIVMTPKARKRFQRDAHAATSLDHPNIVAIYANWNGSHTKAMVSSPGSHRMARRSSREA
jgi:hypothetical protein